MPRITIGEQMVNAFVELGEDIDAIVDEIRHSLDAKAFPTNNSINEAHRCITALGIVNAGGKKNPHRPVLPLFWSARSVDGAKLQTIRRQGGCLILNNKISDRWS
jgi:hypothetical protein